ncbi:arginase family protein [Cryobacterium sp. Hz9]|uniref:arginase family protein n=1 Tax=Cryobacterium sp. Hz9 TaxID=1259167 RepID=UPI00106B4BC9|nr:arginase family protein [Cryobacterium sp. Hz9]TFB71582.1 hypothetical protein E3N85_00005 [Cryobacterium sp. Hz9]
MTSNDGQHSLPAILRAVRDEIIGPVGTSTVPRCSGLAAFAFLLRLAENEKADIAVLGAAFDPGVTFRPDARFGPAHMCEASRMGRSYRPEVKAYPFGVRHELITLLSRLPQEPSRATGQPA